MTRKVQLNLAKLREAEAEEARLRREPLAVDEESKKYRSSPEDEEQYRRKARKATEEVESFLYDDGAEASDFLAMTEEEEEREFSLSDDERIVHRCISRYFSALKNR